MSFAKRTGRTLAVAVGLLLIAVLLLWFRPWSQYPPAKINSLFQASQRVENFRNMGEFFPFKTLHKAGQVSEFTREEKPLNLSYEFDGEKRQLDDFFSQSECYGFAGT